MLLHSRGPRARGYTGLRLIDGKVDVAIRYSPAAKSELFQPGDEIVSINGNSSKKYDYAGVHGC